MSTATDGEEITIYLYIHNCGIRMIRIMNNRRVDTLKQLLPEKMQKYTDFAFYDSDFKYIFDYCTFKFNDIKDYDKILLIRRNDYDKISGDKMKYKRSIENKCEEVGTALLHNMKSIYTDPSFKNEMSRLLDIKKTNMLMKPKVFRKMEKDLKEESNKSEPTKIPTVVPKEKPTKPSSETIEVKW